MSAVRAKDADGAFYGIGSAQIAWTGESWKCATLHPWPCSPQWCRERIGGLHFATFQRNLSYDLQTNIVVKAFLNRNALRSIGHRQIKGFAVSIHGFH